MEAASVRDQLLTPSRCSSAQAGHRAEYARVKREYNTKLVDSLARMEQERAYNHRVRSGALAHIDPSSNGLQLDHLMEMMRTDAFALKLELEKMEREAQEELDEEKDSRRGSLHA